MTDVVALIERTLNDRLPADRRVDTHHLANEIAEALQSDGTSE